jgi:hypothetical protein
MSLGEEDLDEGIVSSIKDAILRGFFVLPPMDEET